MSLQNICPRRASLLALTIFLMTVLLYSCGGSGSSDSNKDSSAMSTDTSAKMSTDTSKMKTDTSKMKSDTSGKGGQPAPTGH